MQAVQLAQVPSKTAQPLRRGWPVGQCVLCSRGARRPARAQGKGVNTRFILNSRGLTRAVTMSSLLERHPGIRDMMDRGELVPDTMARPAPPAAGSPSPTQQKRVLSRSLGASALGGSAGPCRQQWLARRPSIGRGARAWQSGA